MLRWVAVRVGFGRRGVLVLFCNGSYVLGGWLFGRDEVYGIVVRCWCYEW
jgi:hypothetical protein